jgi:hypothetical protein
MQYHPESESEFAVSPEELLRHRSLVESSSWAKPVQKLASFGGAVFGRSIEENVRQLSSGDPLLIEIRKKSAAVVMSTKQYEELLAIKTEFEDLVRKEGKVYLANSEDEFDRLLAGMQSSAHAASMDALFDASANDLATSFKPGVTETGLTGK